MLARLSAVDVCSALGTARVVFRVRRLDGSGSEETGRGAAGRRGLRCGSGRTSCGGARAAGVAAGLRTAGFRRGF